MSASGTIPSRVVGVSGRILQRTKGNRTNAQSDCLFTPEYLTRQLCREPVCRSNAMESSGNVYGTAIGQRSLLNPGQCWCTHATPVRCCSSKTHHFTATWVFCLCWVFTTLFRARRACANLQGEQGQARTRHIRERVWDIVEGASPTLWFPRCFWSHMSIPCPSFFCFLLFPLTS